MPAHRGAFGVGGLAPRLKGLLRLRKKVHCLRVSQVVESSHDLVVVRVNGPVRHGASSIVWNSSSSLLLLVLLRSRDIALGKRLRAAPCCRDLFQSMRVWRGHVVTATGKWIYLSAGKGFRSGAFLTNRHN
jgi:hypothetical protein